MKVEKSSENNNCSACDQKKGLASVGEAKSLNSDASNQKILFFANGMATIQDCGWQVYYAL